MLLTVSFASAESPAQDGFEAVRVQEGIYSFQRVRHGDALPVFRARMRIPSDVWTVLAVLEDVNRACEWTAHCTEMRKLHTLSAQEIVVYARMDAPWPVRDRDIVTRVRVEPEARNLIIARIDGVDTPGTPPRPGVVRMPSMHAAYRFRSLSEREVEVTYDVEVDPGGTLPDWLKTLVSRDLAHDTIARLAARVTWARAQAVYVRRAEELQRNMRNLAHARGATDEDQS
jgi:hypothetical protein